MSPSDKTHDQLSRPCLKKENVTIKDPFQEQLNNEDKMPHNSTVAGKSLLEHKEPTKEKYELNLKQDAYYHMKTDQ
jgi:hypothetical protein